MTLKCLTIEYEIIFFKLMKLTEELMITYKLIFRMLNYNSKIREYGEIKESL